MGTKMSVEHCHDNNTGDHVAVWQWFTDEHQWCSYQPIVSNFIELAQEQGTAEVDLTFVDESLPYIIKLDEMRQYRQDATSLSRIGRMVRRRLVPRTSCLARGVVWEWMGDSGLEWNLFTRDAADVVEEEYQKKVKRIDLRHTRALGMPYLIDLEAMYQQNVYTGNTRRIRRTKLEAQYNIASTPSSLYTLSLDDRVNTDDGSTQNATMSSAVSSVTENATQNTTVSSAASSSIENAPDDSSDKVICKICTVKDCDVICLPCGHIFMCKDCSTKLRKRECPVCKTSVYEFKKIFFG